MPSRISDYALIGDTRTAALTAKDGAIDWMCAPTFESPPIFGALVGGSDAGSFALSVDDVVSTERHYLDDTAVLETRIEASGGTGRLVEAMVPDVSGSLLPQTVLVRTLTCESGELWAEVSFDPRFGLPGRPPHVARRSGALICGWRSLAVALQSFPHLDIEPGRETSVRISAGSRLTLVLSVADRSPAVLLTEESANALVDRATGWWDRWSREIKYDGPFRDDVLRSLITLQLLTYAPSGAPVAAPTTSLPEIIGGSRNWDYRFCWPRDASIGLVAFLSVGKWRLAHAYMHWLLLASRLTRPRIKVLYTLYGKTPAPEREIEGLPGYEGSRPVRVGNGAQEQHQLDVYGWVADAAWLLNHAGHKLHSATWRGISAMADYVARHWDEPDAGIWEVRGEPRHYVHSKMMGWLCLDRTLRLAETHKTPEHRVRMWTEQRDRLKREVRDRGFDPKRGTYTWSYGSSEVDAALLILPILEFEDDALRTEGTISAIRGELEGDDGLVHRYPSRSDGIGEDEGTFLPCSFWLVQALARTGRGDEAERLFEKLAARANDVGLFAEEFDPRLGEQVGNFPQAFTHATLVQAALSLGEGR